MEKCSRKSVMEDLKIFSPFFNDDDYIEITEWANGEGWSIDISDKKLISLHVDELEAINYLVNYLRYNK